MDVQEVKANSNPHQLVPLRVVKKVYHSQVVFILALLFGCQYAIVFGFIFSLGRVTPCALFQAVAIENKEKISTIHKIINFHYFTRIAVK